MPGVGCGVGVRLGAKVDIFAFLIQKYGGFLVYPNWDGSIIYSTQPTPYPVDSTGWFNTSGNLVISDDIDVPVGGVGTSVRWQVTDALFSFSNGASGDSITDDHYLAWGWLKSPSGAVAWLGNGAIQYYISTINPVWTYVTSELTAMSNSIYAGVDVGLVGRDSYIYGPGKVNRSITILNPKLVSPAFVGQTFVQPVALHRPWESSALVNGNVQTWHEGTGLGYRNFTPSPFVPASDDYTIIFVVNKGEAVDGARVLLSDQAANALHACAPTGVAGQAAFYTDGAYRCIVNAPLGLNFLVLRRTGVVNVGLRANNDAEAVYGAAVAQQTWKALCGDAGGYPYNGGLLLMFYVPGNLTAAELRSVQTWCASTFGTVAP